MSRVRTVRVVIVAALLAAALNGQSPVAGQGVEENAHPLPELKLKPFRFVPRPGPTVVVRVVPVDHPCAVPLLNVLPKDGKPDAAMIVPVTPGKTRMHEVAVPAPSCHDVER
jgi:hypothetical protein